MYLRKSGIRRGRWTLDGLLYVAAIGLPLALALTACLVTLAGRRHIDQVAGLTVAAVSAVASTLAPVVRRLRRRRANGPGDQTELHRLVRYCGAVEGAEPELVGVAPSQVRDRRYLPRPDSDERIQTTLRGRRFVVVVGEPSAGKSRAALEAARQLWPRSTLVAPSRSSLRGDSLQRIVELVDSPRSPVILWLDDLGHYLSAGALTVDLLSQWAARYPGVVVLATMQAVEWGNWAFPSDPRPEGRETAPSGSTGTLGVDEIRQRAAAVLAQAARVELARTLETEAERRAAARRYGAHDWTTLGLGEVLGAGPQLLAKLRDGRGPHPWGWAIAEAAADWRQAGLGRPVTRGELEGVAVHYLPERGARFECPEAGLDWATAPIEAGSEVRIVFPRFPGQGREERYEIHDYVAASRARERHALAKPAWSSIVRCESLTAEDLMRIAATVSSRRDHQAAVEVYDRVVERYRKAPEPDLQVAVAMALAGKGFALEKQGELRAAIGAFDQVVKRYGEASEPDLRVAVATALASMELLLRDEGEPKAAVEVFDQVVERRGGASEPAPRTLAGVALAGRQGTGAALGSSPPSNG